MTNVDTNNLSSNAAVHWEFSPISDHAGWHEVDWHWPAWTGIDRHGLKCISALPFDRYAACPLHTVSGGDWLILSDRAGMNWHWRHGLKCVSAPPFDQFAARPLHAVSGGGWNQHAVSTSFHNECLVFRGNLRHLLFQNLKCECNKTIHVTWMVRGLSPCIGTALYSRGLVRFFSDATVHGWVSKSVSSDCVTVFRHLLSILGDDCLLVGICYRHLSSFYVINQWHNQQFWEATAKLPLGSFSQSHRGRSI